VPNASATELIEATAAVGGEVVALSTVFHADVLDDGGRALRTLCSSTGVRVEAIDPIIGGLPGVADANEVPDHLAVHLQATTDRAIRMAEAVHARSVNVAHFLGSPDTPVQRLIDSIGQIVDRATRRSVEVTIEFIPNTGIPDLATAMKIVEAIDVPELTVLLDVWHLARSGGTVEDVALLPPRSIGWIQLSDRVEPPPGTPYVPMSARMLPGDGDLPLDSILMAALTNSPGIAVCAEVFDPANNERSNAEAAELAATAMRQLGFR